MCLLCSSIKTCEYCNITLCNYCSGIYNCTKCSSYCCDDCYLDSDTDDESLFKGYSSSCRFCCEKFCDDCFDASNDLSFGYCNDCEGPACKNLCECSSCRTCGNFVSEMDEEELDALF